MHMGGGGLSGINIEGIEEWLLPVVRQRHRKDGDSAHRGDVCLIELVHILGVAQTVDFFLTFSSRNTLHAQEVELSSF